VNNEFKGNEDGLVASTDGCHNNGLEEMRKHVTTNIKTATFQEPRSEARISQE
jgi:hypothetical protein